MCSRELERNAGIVQICAPNPDTDQDSTMMQADAKKLKRWRGLTAKEQRQERAENFRGEWTQYEAKYRQDLKSPAQDADICVQRRALAVLRTRLLLREPCCLR